MRDLIHDVFVGAFANPELAKLEDQARVSLSELFAYGDRLAFTTEARRSRSGSHEKGLFSWRSTRAEIGDIRLNSGSETQIGLAGKRGLLVV